MDLFSAISKRKSCRNYQMEPLPPKTLAEVDAAISSFLPLYQNVPLSHRVVASVRGAFHVQAPHYLVVGGSGQKGEREQAGFVFEQLALWLNQMGLGCVWLGASKDATAQKDANDIIVMAFGKTIDSPNRERLEFKRKAIEKITNAPTDACIQAVHLAPSGMNTQPWYFEQTANGVLVYLQKLNPPVSLLYKLTELDMGIALCHYALACQQFGRAFHFTKTNELQAKPGYVPFGIIG